MGAIAGAAIRVWMVAVLIVRYARSEAAGLPRRLSPPRNDGGGSRDRFDYTEWRRQGLPHMTLEDLAMSANSLTQTINQED
jgi:hypothetical protein